MVSQRDSWREFKSYHPELVKDVLDVVDDEPVEDASFSEGVFQLVGSGHITNGSCGKFSAWYGCVRSELHNRVTIDGVDYRGKGYVVKVFHSCDKPSCPICFKHGWAVREARMIELRLKGASKRFGLVEHVIVVVPLEYYGLSVSDLRGKVALALISRGVIGGTMIFHGFRYNNPEEARRKNGVMGWYWSPHFHVLGFILGGYKCRDCFKRCSENLGCDGFLNRSYRMYDKDKFIVKVASQYDKAVGHRVAGKRDSVFGTAWYQLNHASVVKGSTRYHVNTWFGVCSYRKLKLSVDFKNRVCPICQHELVKLRYFGNRVFCGDKREFVVDLVEDGRSVWVEDVRDNGG